MTSTCRICRNTENNQIHRTREMMFGTRDRFNYLECGECGTLQITEIPDLAKYYPKDYYSLAHSDEIEFIDTLKKKNGWPEVILSKAGTFSANTSPTGKNGCMICFRPR